LQRFIFREHNPNSSEPHSIVNSDKDSEMLRPQTIDDLVGSKEVSAHVKFKPRND